MHFNRHSLRIIRERSGLTTSALAARAGISQPHLSNIESGRRQPSAALVRRLAHALKIPLVALVADPPEPTSDPGETDGMAGGTAGGERSRQEPLPRDHPPARWGRVPAITSA